MVYYKGQKIKVAITYLVEITLEDDIERDGDVGEIATGALLASEDLHSHCEEVYVSEVDGVDIDDVVSRETDDNEESPEWTAAKEAVKLWDKLRGLRGAVDLKNFPDLNEKQIQFVCDVIAAGKTDKLRTYSGRGMFGRHCPGVVVTHPSEVPTKARYSQDSLGMGTILYMP